MFDSCNNVDQDQDDIEKGRRVKQFHFTGWPDMKAPEFAAPVLQLLEHVNEANPSEAGPVVVHCSAGVGRTGTFITIDSMLKMAKAENKLDVFNFVCQMRAKRMKMIQTAVQYEFLHDALLEALFCGKTTMRTDEVMQTWKTLKSDKQIAGQHGAIDAMYPAISEDKYNGGRMDTNIGKNRFSDKIPPDSGRPYLMSNGNDPGNNYINATFCNGFAKDNMHLMTQVPLANTTGDFWCMIYDYECHTIVDVSDQMNTDETCAKYWPEEGRVTCGSFTVEMIKMDVIGKVIERRLKYYKSSEQKESRIVTLIQFTDWPNPRDIPKSVYSFLKLLETVEKGRRDSEDQRIAVMCLDGVTRCGLLCASISIIDKIKEQQLVDVFQATKRVRKSRHDTIPTVDQYRFCYEVAHEYLQAFETYSNFTQQS
ncbi:receptor-type tyrosine-protein phosphatase U-like [Amphiura filiformis]|uniref:receptor-type tyrosine-protein phosphatase U-like n=1 Tax=Amphiura filiformis TaxID=82378 RepID=UPI003B2280BF